MHWKKFFNKEYLGVWDLDNGKLNITFTGFESREIQDFNDSRKTKTVLIGLTDKKPIILNSTNCKAAELEFRTPDIDKWVGGTVGLVGREVKAFGSTVQALRITKAHAQEMTAEELKAAIWEKVKGSDKSDAVIKQVQNCKGNIKSLKLIFDSLK